MKKLLSLLVLAFYAMNGNAQLIVDSLGRVGIGTETPWTGALLSVGSYGNVSYDAAIQSSVSGKQYGTYTLNHTSNPHEIFGAFFNTKNNIGNSIGGRSIALGSNNMSVNQSVVGLVGAAGEGYSAAGILGGKLSTGITTNFAGIYGTEYSGNNLVFGNYSGSYAGFFRGKVRVTDGIYGILLSPANNVLQSEQSGITVLSNRGESVTEKLAQVETVVFPRKELEMTDAEKVVELKEGKSVDSRSDLIAVQYGLAADQLKAVYPELVYEDANGNVSINYVEMIPLLVQSINELSKELAVLKGVSSRKAPAQTTSISENVSDVDVVRMDQNKPNPFSESTVIPLNIPRETQSANIYIYDMSGKQVQSIPVSERGETDITVYASDLSAGMFIYALVVDGKVVVTRRMIVTNK